MTSEEFPFIGVSVVVPVYRSTDSLRALVERVSFVLSRQPFEIILVDDGSPSDTWEVVRELSRNRSFVRGVRLGKNSGQHSATLAGIRKAKFPVVVTIDDDLQNKPEDIPILISRLSVEVDLVYGTPLIVSQSRWRKLTSYAMRQMMRNLFGVSHAQHLSSFRAFRTSLREGFVTQLGPGVSVDAVLAWSTDRVESVCVQHDVRQGTRSTYTFRKLLKFAIDTATGYSTRPLQIASVLGAMTSVVGFSLLVGVLFSVVFFGSSVPGFPFLASVTLVFSGIQLLSLGLIGEYLARMHVRVMGKPSYVVAEYAEREETANSEVPLDGR